MDTDVCTYVVVLAVSTFNEVNSDYLWLAFGTGQNFVAYQFLNVTLRACSTFPMFHAFTKCDTVVAEVRKQ